MAQQKLPIKDILAAIDMGAKNVWDEISDEEKKQVSFWLLNRYVSSVKGNREAQELAVFKTNEYYNNFGDNTQNSTNFADFTNGKNTGAFGQAVG